MYFRLHFIQEYKQLFELGLEVPAVTGATRWTSSTREQIKCLVEHYSSWVGLFQWAQESDNGLWDPSSQQESKYIAQMKGYCKRLTNHEWLMKLFYWLDVLELEATVSKMGEGITSIGQANRIREVIHDAVPKFADPQFCPNLESSVKRGNPIAKVP